MNRSLQLLLTFLFIGGWYFSAHAQESLPKERYTLTHHMTEEEKALFHLVGKDYVATDPPPGEIRNIAEFDQMEGVLISYANNFGISYELIAAMSQVVMVTTVVESTGIQNAITNQYENNGVNMDNVNFLVTEIDSYWSRDYGPWYVAYGEDQIGIVDFIYNRPNRPNDNAIPPKMADFLGIEWFGMDLITAGGNYMTDGEGISASSDLTWEENPTLTPADIDEMVESYLGVGTYHVLDDPNNTYIDHIDCWGKYLGVNKVLIREVPESHPQFDEIEATAAYFENQVSSWGYNYDVYRVWTPNNEPYTNSLIINDHVFVPITNGQWDDEALAAYEEAMPGYTIQGFTGSWESTDALHCRTKGVADRNTLYISHMPILGDQEIQTEYEIQAEVTAYSGEEMSNVMVYYWIDGESQPEIVMSYEGDKMYSATLPSGPEGTKISYYISAQDVAANTGNHPYIGEPDPHTFYVGQQLFPAMVINIESIETIAQEGDIDMADFEIQNNGEWGLDYTLEYTTEIINSYSYEIEDSPGQNAWDDNTYTELGWTEFTAEAAEGDLSLFQMDFTWNTDQYGWESTLKVESPAGTEAIIAAGIADGSYTLTTPDFSGEAVEGTWKIWIEDSYGDGGHQATDITVTFFTAYEIAPWLTVDPLEGDIEVGNSEMISVTCDASELPEGIYYGMIMVYSNDPVNQELEIPVTFTVDNTIGIDEFGDSRLIIAAPNPFNDHTEFVLNSENNHDIELLIYNASGKLIRALSGNNTRYLRWDGRNEDGSEVSKGIYFYQIKAGIDHRVGKLVKY
jgi:agmatine/peptidylarginine deiminase